MRFLFLFLALSAALPVPAGMAQTGNITVSILPTAAVQAGAEYSVNGAPLQMAGTITVATGTYTVTFSTVPGFSTPAAQTKTVTASSSITFTGTYTPLGSLMVSIGPPGAVTGGAQWSVDGGPAQASGSTLSGLSAGNHSVSFTAASGYITPVSQTVAVTSGTTKQASATYVQAGTLTMNLAPPGAISAGAEWKVDAAALQVSGSTVTGLVPGVHTVTFLPVQGYFTPATQSVTISAGVNTSGTVTYIQPASVTVNLAPPGAVGAGAAWKLNSGSAQASGTTVTNIFPGGYTISYAAVSGYDTPPGQDITLTPGEALAVTGTYVVPAGSLTVGIVPAGAVTGGATWTVDDGAPVASGSTVTGLTPGMHNVTFNPVAGYDTPALQPVNIIAHQTTVTSGTYALRPGALEVDIAGLPGNLADAPLWSLDGGALQTSGSNISGIPSGQHEVTFAPVPGYGTPAPQAVNILPDQTLVTTGSYAGIPIIQVLLNPTFVPLTSGSGVVNMGTVAAGKTVKQQITIQNLGTGPLLNLAASLTGPDIGGFSVLEKPYVVGQPSRFLITYAPYTIGASSAVLHIASNDPVTPDFTIPLEASAIGGPVDLSYASGLYACLMSSTAAQPYNAASFTLAKTGGITGNIVIQGKVTPVAGNLDAHGRFGGRPEQVQLWLTSGSGGQTKSANYSIAGSLTGAGGSVPFTAWHAAYGADDPVTEQPRYTVLLTSTDTSAATPQGAGYATLIVSRQRGGVTLIGKLADGAPIMQAGNLFNTPLGHQIYVFDRSLYTDRGYLVGPITFQPAAAADFSTNLKWMRPPTHLLYTAGFDTWLLANGAGYETPAPGTAPVPFTSGTFCLSDGELSNPIMEPVQFNTNGTLIFTGSNANAIHVNITRGNGFFTGSFLDPASNLRVPFYGLLYQNQVSPGGAGYFIDPVVSGTSLTGTSLSGRAVLTP